MAGEDEVSNLQKIFTFDWLFIVRHDLKAIYINYKRPKRSYIYVTTINKQCAN
jgi:hypothetical protein